MGPGSDVSGEPALTVLAASNRSLLEATRIVLATPDLPDLVLIGGLAVTTRVSSAGAVHRATTDIDLVTTYREPEPEAVDVIAAHQGSATRPLVVGGVKVDIIPTNPITDVDLEGHEDQHVLFLAGHRWAFETAQAERLAVAGEEQLTVPVATAAGLVAAKSHAVGFPSVTRRATKHGADLLDLFRLVDLFGRDGTLVDELRAGPAELARIIADVCDREVTSNPIAAAHKMASASPTPVEADDVADIIGEFVNDLRR